MRSILLLNYFYTTPIFIHNCSILQLQGFGRIISVGHQANFSFKCFAFKSFQDFITCRISCVFIIKSIFIGIIVQSVTVMKININFKSILMSTRGVESTEILDFQCRALYLLYISLADQRKACLFFFLIARKSCNCKLQNPCKYYAY